MNQVWPRVDNFCYCIPLKTGSLIIGYASLFVSVFFVSSISWSLYKVVKFVKSHEHFAVQEHTPEEVANVALSLYITHGYFLLVMMYSIAISAVLIVGMYKNKPSYLRVFVYASMVAQGLALFLMAVTALFFGLYFAIPVLVWNGLLFYCLIIVRSTYMDMIEETERKDHEMHNLAPQQALEPINDM